MIMPIYTYINMFAAEPILYSDTHGLNEYQKNLWNV